MWKPKITTPTEAWTHNSVLSRRRTATCMRCAQSIPVPFQVFLQRVERAVPVAGEGGQELLGYLHRGGVEPVPHPASLARFRALSAHISLEPHFE
jgi:hypothetical protein